jgi:hypothetical protein
MGAPSITRAGRGRKRVKSNVTAETMSPRLKVTLSCKADALEIKIDLSRITAYRRTDKRVKRV